MKKKKTSYYEMLESAIIEFGLPKKVYYIYYDSNSNCKKINDEIEQCIISKKINVFISLSYYFINPDLLFKIQKNVYRIRIDGDDGLIFNFYSKWYAQLFDLNITQSLFNKLKFEELSYNAMIYVGNISNKNTLTKLNYNNIFVNEVSFIGNIPKKSQRERYFNFLKENNINITIYGENKNTKKLTIKDKYYHYTKTKINLNFSGIKLNLNLLEDREILNIEPSIEKQKIVTGRIFEVLSVGGFLLTEYSPTLEYFFEIGVDLVVFYNKKDLIEKIEYYLNNEAERAKIAKSGYKKFQDNYEYFVWSPNFVNEIEANQNKKNIVKSYIWPKKIKQFNSRFLNMKYLFSSGYINMILRYFDVYYIIKLILKKYLLKFKL